MRALSLCLLLAVLAGCSSGQSSADFAESAKAGSFNAAEMRAQDGLVVASSSPAEAKLASTGSSVVVKQRDVIRRAELAVRVPNVEKAEQEVSRLIAQRRGFVESTTSSDLATEHPVLTMAIRVPVGEFEGTMGKIEGLGVRLSKTISSEDVTGQLVDLEARLRTMRVQEETYRNLLRRQSELQSIVSMQDKLTEVRANIESMDAQRKALSGLAALSTITLRLEQDAVAHAAPQDPNWMAQIWAESTTRLGYALRALAYVVLNLVVFCPFWIPLVLLARKWMHPRTKPTSAAL